MAGGEGFLIDGKGAGADDVAHEQDVIVNATDVGRCGESGHGQGPVLATPVQQRPRSPPAAASLRVRKSTALGVSGSLPRSAATLEHAGEAEHK